MIPERPALPSWQALGKGLKLDSGSNNKNTFVSFYARTLDPAASPLPPGFARTEVPPPTIEDWFVAGHDRIVGTLRDATSAANGRKIITSPVLRVRRSADDGTPIAQTQSGSRYALAEPASAFGEQRAENFLRFKCAIPGPHDLPSFDGDMGTGLMKLPS